MQTIFKGGPAAVALWGSPVTGLAPARLHSLRIAALRAKGPIAKGTAVGLKLRAYEPFRPLDPAARYFSQVVGTWATVVWDAVVPDQMLATVFQAAVGEQCQARTMCIGTLCE